MTPTATRTRPPARAGRAGGRSQSARGNPSPAVARRRRRTVLGVVAVLGAIVAAAVLLLPIDKAVREVTLPLQHEDIIRQQAGEKDLDPALIAAIIYEESRFRPRRSPAGAEGLMQILPDTANFIADRSGGTRFEVRDLATPQINISYGAWYLRHLLDRYGGDETLAVAAYNAGATNVDRWVSEAGGPEAFDAGEHVPFPETRHYVADVEKRREQYREHYRSELGL